MYKTAHTEIFSEQNIKSGFHATGLIPFNLEHILSSLTITKTPSPLSTSHGQQTQQQSSPWTSETPRNLAELAKQMQLVQSTLEHQSQSPTEPLFKVVKDCQLAISGAALLV